MTTRTSFTSPPNIFGKNTTGIFAEMQASIKKGNFNIAALQAEVATLITSLLEIETALENIANNNFTFNGIKTFTSAPVCAVQATTNTQLTNKLYVDNAVSQAPGGASTWSLFPALQDVDFGGYNVYNVDLVTCTGLNINDILTTTENTGQFKWTGGISTNFTTVGIAGMTVQNAPNNYLVIDYEGLSHATRIAFTDGTSQTTAANTANWASFPALTAVNLNSNIVFADTTIQSTAFTSAINAQISTNTTNIALCAPLAGTNTWTGTNAFNTNLPTSTLTPTTATELVTKAYADLSARLAGTNTWTGTNAFNTNLPTSTLTPTTTTQLVTKAYADLKGTLAAANAWTSTNTFNSNLPTSTLTPTSNSQFVTKVYADLKGNLASANTWIGINTFSANVIHSSTSSFTGLISASTATLSGLLTAPSPTFTGTINAAAATLSGLLTAPSPTFTGTITAAAATFSGAITSSGSNTFSGANSFTGLTVLNAGTGTIIPIGGNQTTQPAGLASYRSAFTGGDCAFQNFTGGGPGGFSFYRAGFGADAQTFFGAINQNNGFVCPFGITANNRVYCKTTDLVGTSNTLVLPVSEFYFANVSSGAVSCTLPTPSAPGIKMNFRLQLGGANTFTIQSGTANIYLFTTASPVANIVLEYTGRTHITLVSFNSSWYQFT